MFFYTCSSSSIKVVVSLYLGSTLRLMISVVSCLYSQNAAPMLPHAHQPTRGARKTNSQRAPSLHTHTHLSRQIMSHTIGANCSFLPRRSRFFRSAALLPPCRQAHKSTLSGKKNKQMTEEIVLSPNSTKNLLEQDKNPTIEIVLSWLIVLI